jgi:hypothetical protein
MLSDFFLFDHTKLILSDRYFQSTDDILSEIYIILVFIEKAILLDVLLSGCKGWSNITISMGTTSYYLSNRAFDLPFI